MADIISFIVLLKNGQPCFICPLSISNLDPSFEKPPISQIPLFTY